MGDRQTVGQTDRHSTANRILRQSNRKKSQRQKVKHKSDRQYVYNRDSQTMRQLERQTLKQSVIGVRCTDTERQTERRDGQTDRQTVIQTDRVISQSIIDFKPIERLSMFIRKPRNQ